MSPTGASPQPYTQVPVLETGAAIGCLVLNVILPGIGTIVAGIVGGQKLIGRGIAQLILAVIIVGWVWAVVTGFQLVTNASWATRTPPSAPRAG